MTASAKFGAEFQARLRRARYDRGLTQNQIALVLDLKLSTYKKYETRSSFPLHLLPKLSAILDRPLGYWIYGHEIPKKVAR